MLNCSPAVAAACRDEQSREEEEWRSGFCLQIVAPAGILMAAGFSTCHLFRINMHSRSRCAHVAAQHLAKVDVKDVRSFRTSEEERRRVFILLLSADPYICSVSVLQSAASPDSLLLVGPHIWMDEEPTHSTSNLHSIWILSHHCFTSYFKPGSHEVMSGSGQGQR